jgi:hypothetical protein
MGLMQKISVELNFFYMHYNDAKKFAQWAYERRDEDVNPSIYVRHSILSVVFASEALINRVLNEFARDADSEIVKFMMDKKAGILDKWYLAPFLCCGNEPPIPFEKGEEPYQSFKELIDIRNWLAHPKVDTFLDAKTEPNSTINIGESNEEYPWLEMLKGEQWPQNGIPKNPFEIDHTHADSSINILNAMIKALNDRLYGRMHEGWLDLITVKDADNLHHYKAPVETIWSGYGGANK